MSKTSTPKSDERLEARKRLQHATAAMEQRNREEQARHDASEKQRQRSPIYRAWSAVRDSMAVH